MTRPVHYLDHNATAPIRPEAAAAVMRALTDGGNPSSVHAVGRRARAVVDDAREAVAALVNARPEQVIFTSGGTESDVLALRGCGRPRAIVSAVEHQAVLKAHPDAAVCPVTADGVIDLAALETLLAEAQADGQVVVSVMLANNETGVIQPVKDVVRLARAHGALVHCDAVQGPGRIFTDVHALRVDLLSLSAHKIGGPPGVGALIATDPAALQPLFAGGQERGKRAGTENVPGLAGFAAAARVVAERWREEAAVLDTLRRQLEEGILAAQPQAVIWGGGAARLPNTVCVGLPGLAAQGQLMTLDLAGVCVSAGAACSSGKVGPSHVLQAMGATDAAAREAIRVSLGWSSTAADVEAFLRAWQPLAARAVA